MSDDPAAFARAVDVMFAEFDQDVAAVARNWIMAISYEMVFLTRGPGNQRPDDTTYEATGRLRAGYSATLAPGPTMAGRWDGGPYDNTDDGSETSQRLNGEIASLTDKLPLELNIWNDVAYGYLVHEGLRGDFAQLIGTPWMLQVEAMGSDPATVAAAQE